MQTIGVVAGVIGTIVAILNLVFFVIVERDRMPASIKRFFPIRPELNARIPATSTLRHSLDSISRRVLIIINIVVIVGFAVFLVVMMIDTIAHQKDVVEMKLYGFPETFAIGETAQVTLVIKSADPTVTIEYIKWDLSEGLIALRTDPLYYYEDSDNSKVREFEIDRDLSTDETLVITTTLQAVKTGVFKGKLYVNVDHGIISLNRTPPGDRWFELIYEVLPPAG